MVARHGRGPGVSAARLQERNTELGRVMREARMEKGLTQEDCSEYLGTSRQRYGQMEAGKIPIPVIEFEAMLTFLDVPKSRVWPDPLGSTTPTYEVWVRVRPGEAVNVVLRTHDDSEGSAGLHNSSS